MTEWPAEHTLPGHVMVSVAPPPTQLRILWAEVRFRLYLVHAPERAEPRPLLVMRSAHYSQGYSAPSRLQLISTEQAFISLLLGQGVPVQLALQVLQQCNAKYKRLAQAMVAPKHRRVWGCEAVEVLGAAAVVACFLGAAE